MAHFYRENDRVKLVEHYKHDNWHFPFNYLCYLAHENKYFIYKTESTGHETFYMHYTDQNDVNMNFNNFLHNIYYTFIFPH